MSEIVIKSARDNGRLITVANIHDGIAIFTGPQDAPLKFSVCIQTEDFPAVLKALQQISNEIRGEQSI